MNKIRYYLAKFRYKLHHNNHEIMSQYYRDGGVQ